MEGIKVVEVGMWVAGPAAAGILGDWGADVIKIEPPASDPMRGIMSLRGHTENVNPPFELDNRNKRSVGLDLSIPEAREIAAALVDESDVFVTNARPGALVRSGLDYETLSARNPRLVYAHITGYGLTGDERDRAAFDVGAFWSRAGVAAALVPEGAPLPYQRGGMGDHMAALAAAGAVSAALFARERTGVGQLVSVSLLRVGMYMVGWDINMAMRLGFPTVPMTINAPPNPMISAYTAGDGLRFWLLGLQGDRLWPDLLRAIDRTEWATDERYATLASRFENSAALVRDLGAVFSTRTLEAWSDVFDREDVWWAPVRYPHEVVDDPQARAAGGFVTVPLDDDGEIEMVASPIDFLGTPWAVRGPAPEFAQHTEEVLLELGHSWDRIAELKDLGAIPLVRSQHRIRSGKGASLLR
jgi:crotonobetainyl-CoA:carnitine CoA-transferase CaiB-like acyl-CoA transferase